MINSLVGCLLIFLSFTSSAATEDVIESFHLGGLHPNGVDVVGYSVEKKLKNNIYSFYNFGIPSFSALGINYYQAYNDSGVTGTIGVGIGSIMYASLAYQWKIHMMDYLKLGAGFATGVAYTGAYPVLSYEHRF